jgi:hypothetical protein
MMLSTTARMPKRLSEIKPYQEIQEPRLRLAVLELAKRTKNLGVCLKFSIWLSPCRESRQRWRQQKIVQLLAGHEWIDIDELQSVSGMSRKIINEVTFRLKEMGCIKVEHENRKPHYMLIPENLPKLGHYREIA